MENLGGKIKHWGTLASKKRPSFPDVRRQWLGVALMVGTIVLLEGLAATFGSFKASGLILLFVSIFSTYWSGLRVGLINAAIIVSYALLISFYPISNFEVKKSANPWLSFTWNTIFFMGLALVVGTVQNKLIKARMKAYDATLVAESETEHRIQTEDSLRSSEDMRRLIVESSMDAIVILDQNCRITLWNPVAEQLFGWSSTEALGSHFFVLIGAPEARPETAEGRTELMACAKDGREFPAELAIVPHDTSEGKLFVGFVRDITERKKIETVLQDANDALELRVQERTAALAVMFAEVQLNREAAEKASSAKSGFLSRLSHELRTPLNSILGFAQLMELQAKDPSQRANVEQIIRGGHHLHNLINEVLDLAKIEAGRISISLESVAVAPLIQEAVELVEPLARERDIKIEVAPTDGEEILVIADRQRLTQILLNLLSNAVKYNRHAGTIRIACSRASGRVRLEVTDTGLGIDANDTSRLFTPFERLGVGNIEGTGLGLTLSRGLAQAMEGELTLASSSPEGSTFTLDLPSSSTKPVADVVRLNAFLSSRVQPPSDTKKVLYIEDNPSNLHLMKSLLESVGNIDFNIAMQGKLGIELARQQRPDIILLDLNLPDIHGIEVLLDLRSHPETQAIPVAVVSAATMDNMESRALAAGATAFLEKPINVGALIELLETVLWHRDSAQAA